MRLRRIPGGKSGGFLPEMGNLARFPYEAPNELEGEAASRAAVINELLKKASPEVLPPKLLGHRILDLAEVQSDLIAEANVSAGYVTVDEEAGRQAYGLGALILLCDFRSIKRPFLSIHYVADFTPRKVERYEIIYGTMKSTDQVPKVHMSTRGDIELPWQDKSVFADFRDILDSDSQIQEEYLEQLESTLSALVRPAE